MEELILKLISRQKLIGTNLRTDALVLIIVIATPIRVLWFLVCVKHLDFLSIFSCKETLINSCAG